MWQLLAPVIGGAILGAMQEDKAKKATRDHNLMQAEIHKYSPWTGMQGQPMVNNHDAMSGALKGGLGGLSLGAELSKMGMGKASPTDAQQLGLENPGQLKGRLTPASRYDEFGNPVA